MTGPDDPTDLAGRIAKAKAKQAERATRAERRRKESANAPASMALRYSSELVAAVLVGVGLGLLIDHFAGTSPWGLLVMMGFGIATGFRNLMRAAKQLSEQAQAAAKAAETTDDEKAE